MAQSARVDVNEMLGREGTALLDMLRGLSAEERETSTECRAWNVKGLALHPLRREDDPGLSFHSLLDGSRWPRRARPRLTRQDCRPTAMTRRGKEGRWM